MTAICKAVQPREDSVCLPVGWGVARRPRFRLREVRQQLSLRTSVFLTVGKRHCQSLELAPANPSEATRKVCADVCFLVGCWVSTLLSDSNLSLHGLPPVRFLQPQGQESPCPDPAVCPHILAGAPMCVSASAAWLLQPPAHLLSHGLSSLLTVTLWPTLHPGLHNNAFSFLFSFFFPAPPPHT